MIKSIFLLSVFVTSNSGYTVTNLTPMPDMDTCKKAEKLMYVIEQKQIAGWTKMEQYAINVPVKTDCVEL